MAVEHITWQFENGKPPVLKRIWLSPLKAIYYRCLMCTGLYHTKIEQCTSIYCPLYPYRLTYLQYKPVREQTPWKDYRKRLNLPQTHTIKQNGELKEISLNMQTLIRHYCLNCAGNKKATKQCRQHFCSLWPFRPGVTPQPKQKLEARGVNFEDYEQEKR